MLVRIQLTPTLVYFQANTYCSPEVHIWNVVRLHSILSFVLLYSCSSSFVFRITSKDTCDIQRGRSFVVKRTEIAPASRKKERALLIFAVLLWYSWAAKERLLTDSRQRKGFTTESQSSNSIVYGGWRIFRPNGTVEIGIGQSLFMQPHAVACRKGGRSACSSLKMHFCKRLNGTPERLTCH